RLHGRAVWPITPPEGADPPGAHECESDRTPPRRPRAASVPGGRPRPPVAIRRLPGQKRVPGERHRPPDGPPVLGGAASFGKVGGSGGARRVSLRETVPGGEREARKGGAPEAGGRAAHPAV